jgi:hypothetical protein
MKFLNSRIFWGFVVILGGVMLLLDNLDLINFGEVFWAVIAILGALVFFSIFGRNRTHTWSLVPGISLVGVSATILVKTFTTSFGDVWGGAILLGSIGLGFLSILLVERDTWWAMVPAGVMISIGLVSGLEQLYGSQYGVGLFLLGMAITFALLPLLPASPGLGAFSLITSGQEYFYMGPVVLILIGILLVIKSLTTKNNPQGA